MLALSSITRVCPGGTKTPELSLTIPEGSSCLLGSVQAGGLADLHLATLSQPGRRPTAV